MNIFFIAAVFLMTVAYGGNHINAIPGKSLNEVKIGASIAELRQIGFMPDQGRASSDPSISYLVKGEFLVRLKSGRVVQVWSGGSSIKNLKINGKQLPKKISANSLKKTLKSCEIHQGSGGTLVYCEGRGVEFSFPGADGPVGFSVISPAEVDEIIGGSK